VTENQENTEGKIPETPPEQAEDLSTEPTKLDGDPDHPLPALISACLWSVPLGTALSVKEIVNLLEKAGRRTVAARVSATLYELMNRLNNDPISPVQIQMTGNQARLKPKSEVIGILGQGFTIEPLTEDAMAILAAIIYWPRPKPPTRNQLQNVFGMTVHHMDRFVIELLEANAIYTTRAYDNHVRFRSTQSVLDRLGVRTKEELPMWKKMKEELLRLDPKDPGTQAEV
jgi:chromosome segregation and condensation protein ScpB